MFWKRAAAKTVGVAARLVQFACVLHITLEHVITVIWCEGPSMYPTINSGDVVLAEPISVKRKRLQKGDVVSCRNPMKPTMFLCKRIAAMPGDRVFSEEINSCITVPRGHVWLVGDNKGNSLDSRNTYGPIPYGLMKTRVIMKIWPPGHIGSVGMPEDEESS